MLNILKKFKDAKAALTTYNIGLMQSKAYRVLKSHSDKILAEFGISSTDWALLGMLFDAPGGLRVTEAAKILGVETPFITELGEKLHKLKLIDWKNVPEDGRVKIIALTAHGKTLIPKIERVMLKNSKSLISGMSIADILAYRRVLDGIVKNSEKE